MSFGVANFYRDETTDLSLFIGAKAVSVDEGEVATKGLDTMTK